MFCLFLIRELGLSIVLTAKQLMNMFSSVEKYATHATIFILSNKSKPFIFVSGGVVSCNITNAESLVDMSIHALFVFVKILLKNALMTFCNAEEVTGESSAWAK